MHIKNNLITAHQYFYIDVHENKSGMNQIRKLRELRNYTQKFMAEKLGMSQSNYARIENGSIELRKDILIEISKILNISVDIIHKFNENDVLKSMLQENTKIPHQINHSTEILLLHIHQLYKDQISLLENRIKFQESLLTEKIIKKKK